MARKRKKSNAKRELITLNSSLKKLQSYLIDPNMLHYMYSGAFSGIRQRLLTINYDVLRSIVHQVPILNAIINTRIDQMQPFCKRAVEKSDDKGFEILPVKGYKGKEDELEQLYAFFEQTGFEYNSDREDDLMDFMQMFVRETLTIDQVAAEIQRNRFGEVAAFWLLDGATIERTAEKNDFDRNVKFVQRIDLKIANTYTNDDIVFDYKNKRVDIKHRGYGYSNVEMAIDTITTILFGYRYIRDQLVRDKVPKGFIAVLGDADSDQLDSIRRYWYAAMSGAGGRWNIPILPSGKEGVGIDWKSIQPSNKDMEYHKTMMFVSSICAAVFSIDLAELGLKTDDSQAIIGESGQPRIEASKDRGLGSMLTFFEQFLNKILRKVTTKYALRFAGFEPDDQLKRARLDKVRVETYCTINEIRKELGLELLEEDYANVVLNPQAVQLYQASKAQESMAQEGASEEEGEYGGEEEEEDEEGLYKSLSDKENIKIVIE